MPLSPDFLNYALELVEGLGPVEAKRMFGGALLSHKGVSFAVLDDDTFFMKADVAMGAEMKAGGAKPWAYSIGKDGKVKEIAYWSLPASAADDPDEATALAKRSHAIAVRAAAEKAKPKPKKAAPKKAAAKKTPARAKAAPRSKK
jgi:DNA transformation protein